MAARNRVGKRPRVYYTGLVPELGEHLQKEVRGRGWSMKMRFRPDKCRHDYDPASSRNYDREPEIVICARDFFRAEAALALFIDSYQVIGGHPIWDIDLRPIPEEDSERKDLGEMLGGRSVKWTTGDFDLTATLARTASRNRRFAYAIALYGISCQIHAKHPMDLDPANYPYRARSEIHRDHVRFAYAIIAAYAVIEQLKLNPEPKSFNNGAWITTQRQTLETKLKQAGVDLTETLSWYLRGGKTKLEIDRPRKIVKMCPWS